MLFQSSPPDFLHFDSFHVCSPFSHIGRPSVLFLRMALSLGTRVSLCGCLPYYCGDACLFFIMRTALSFSYEDTPIASVSSRLALHFWRLCRFSKIYRTIAFGFSFDACPISLSALALRSFALSHPFFYRLTERSRWAVLHDSTRVR